MEFDLWQRSFDPYSVHAGGTVGHRRLDTEGGRRGPCATSGGPEFGDGAGTPTVRASPPYVSALEAILPIAEGSLVRPGATGRVDAGGRMTGNTDLLPGYSKDELR